MPCDLTDHKTLLGDPSPHFQGDDNAKYLTTGGTTINMQEVIEVLRSSISTRKLDGVEGQHS